jgi:hypothetical protein
LVFALHHSIIMSIHDHVHHHLMYIAGWNIALQQLWLSCYIDVTHVCYVVNPKIMFGHLAYMCARLVMLGNTCNIALKHMPHTHVTWCFISFNGNVSLHPYVTFMYMWC